MLRCYNEETRREIHGQVAQLVERSPEKAGVGGSSPSLATTFSNTYRHLVSSFGSNWFQYWLADSVSTSPSRASTASNSLIPFNALKVSVVITEEARARSCDKGAN